jgi:AcrR family transcriptional regulator
MTASATESATATSEGQRERAHAALARLVGERGYVKVKVEEIAREAHISCTTFYELFADREACYLDAHAALAARLQGELATRLDSADPAFAGDACLELLVGLALEHPAAFRLIGHEALLAGPRAVAARDELLTGLAAALERAWDGAPASTLVPDLPARLLLGGWMRALGMGVRGGVTAHETLLRELLAWTRSYGVPAGERRWTRALEAAICAAPLPASAGVEAAPVPRGRHGLPPTLVARVQRERLIFATAAAVGRHGYERTSVADIVTAAGVSREVFYAQFANKREAFAATQRLFLERSVGALAGVYFAPAPSWPEQLWRTLGALLEFFAAHASFARAALVETYAVDGRGTLTDEFVMGFATFLQRGWMPPSKPPAREQSAAMIGAALEPIVMWVSADRTEQLAQLRPVLAYVLLAPTLGVRAACELVRSYA